MVVKSFSESVINVSTTDGLKKHDIGACRPHIGNCRTLSSVKELMIVMQLALFLSIFEVTRPSLAWCFVHPNGGVKTVVAVCVYHCRLTYIDPEFEQL